MATKDQELHLASGTAIKHVDHDRWEYLNEMYFSVVLHSPELGLDQATQSPYLCFSIKWSFKFFFLIPLLKYGPFCSRKPGQRKQLHKSFKVLWG